MAQISQSPLLRLPLEIRLMIYEYALDVPNEYMDRPLIVVNDRGNSFTARGRYRALSMCPSWVGENGKVRSLLSVNRQIHDEVEDFLYSHNTLFFLNAFSLDRLGAFLDTLSETAHGRAKADVKEYERAGKILSEKLPNWSSVVFYLDPRFYFPSAAVGGRELSARGVWYLATKFGAMRKEMQFFALPSIHRHVMDEAKRKIQMGRRGSQERAFL
ncbi:hypothetical protein AARAC_000784 [Aspergillus arachidicola]|uniref:DUF7730 domain-containing protein n=1 Tax=Aspergillus arachidicola TaxID=656916 RepID=A0A2G7G4I7_9EURO|nr:hypothetical protein AARAC_000784 [Aspergillus arachidicola]